MLNVKNLIFLSVAAALPLSAAIAKNSKSQISYESTSKIWGFHVHMDVESKRFPESLKVKQALLNFLEEQNIPVARTDAYRPGYGPHEDSMWEVRIEPVGKDVDLAHAMGKVVDWILYHPQHPSMWIHPVTHNETIEDLTTEYIDHQERRIVFGREPHLNLNFFKNPPRDSSGQIVDTRIPNLFSQKEQQNLLDNLPLESSTQTRRKASEYRINLGYTANQAATIQKVTVALEQFFKEQGIKPKSQGYYCAGENGPHILQGYEIQLSGKMALRELGQIISFFMLNHEDLPVYLHSLTADEAQQGLVDENEAFEDYDQRKAYIDTMMLLDLSLFDPALPIASFDIHYAYEEGEKDKAQSLQQAFLDKFANEQIGFAIEDHYNSTVPIGPWKTPSWGIDLIPKSTKKDFHNQLLEMVDWLKSKYRELACEGMLIAHPNTKDNHAKNPDFTSMQQDHFERLWKIMGPIYPLYDMWGRENGPIELSDFVKKQQGVLSDEEIIENLRARGATNREIERVMP